MEEKKIIIIKNATIVTLGNENKILKKHVLVIEDDRIQKIVPENEIYNAQALKEQIIGKSQVIILNAEGKVVMPGFINAHMHFYSSFARGLIKAKPSANFSQILENLWWRLDRKLTLDDCYYSALVAMIDAIKKGTTTLIDHHASPFAAQGSLFEIAKAVKEVGLRASLCYELSDRDGAKIAADGIDENIQFIKWVQSSDNINGSENDDFLRAMFGLHASFTIEEKTLNSAVEKLADLAAAAGATPFNVPVGFHIHCAEDLADQKITQQKTGLRVVERLHKANILGPQTICAHAVHLDDKELDILAQTKTKVVHNPQSNMNNAVGVANILKMKEKGILVGLGTDAMTVNMLEELRSAVWVQRLFQKHPNVAFVEATELLVNNNPKIANDFWSRPSSPPPFLGELKAGAKADIVIIDYIPPTELDNSNFYGHLVFGLAESVVDTTIINGEILMQNKKLVSLDEERICARSRELASELWKRF